MGRQKLRKSDWSLLAGEYRAIAKCLEGWADAIEKNRENVTKKYHSKIDSFRHAMASGIGTGRHHDTQPEIIHEDLIVAEAMMAQAEKCKARLDKQKSLDANSVFKDPVILKIGGETCRFYWPDRKEMDQINWWHARTDLSERARKLVAIRYRLNMSMEKREIENRRSTLRYNPEHSVRPYLAWIFQDLCVVDQPHVVKRKLRDHLLGVLLKCGYSPLACYHRIQLSLRVETARVVPSVDVDVDTVYRVCEKFEKISGSTRVSTAKISQGHDKIVTT